MTDNNGGERVRKYPLSAFVEALEAEGGSGGTTDVADRVGCSYELAYKRLHELFENDEIDRSTVGNTHIWTLNN